MQWYTVNITSGFEQKIKNTIETQDNLRRVSKTVLIPTIKKKRFLRDKLYHYSEKLFPGYVFISCEDHDAGKIFSAVADIPGILNMSGIKGVRRIFEKIYDEEIIHVFGLISDHTRKVVEENHNIKVDEKVKVIEGPFSSFQGIVLEMHKSKNKETKVKIGTSLFNGGVSHIVVPVSFVETV